MIPEITGSVAGIGTSGFNIPLTPKTGAPVGPQISPVYYFGDSFPPVFAWQYYEAGMIVWSASTCAATLYGPLLEYYGLIGQFLGPVGCPMTDVTQLPDGTDYAVFENAVLWVDSSGAVRWLPPQPDWLVKAAGGIDPSPSGIEAFAQQKLQSMANTALQANSQLSSNVSRITATITSLSTNSGACNSRTLFGPGTSVVRSHVFGVHLDFSLAGCAGIFGGASADLHVALRLTITPPTVSGFLVSFHIDGVSTPLGVGETDMYAALYQALQGYYGKDLIGQSLTLPKQAKLLAALVSLDGHIVVYLEPGCGTSMTLELAGAAGQENVLALLRQLRDRLARAPDGTTIVQVVDAVSPAIAEAIASESDARPLSRSLAHLLERAFQSGNDVPVRLKELGEPAGQLRGLLDVLERHGNSVVADQLVARAVRFAREEIRGEATFGEVMHSLAGVLAEETRHIDTG